MAKMEKVFILSAKRYSFTDKDTGEVKEGITVFYIPNIKPATSTDGATKGYVPVKASFSLNHFPDFSEVPGYYDIDYDMTADSQGKPKFSYNGIKKVS